MARLLDNWLASFLDWTLPRSESRESFLLWTGLFTLSSVMKRKVYWPKSMMGGYTVYPHLYVIFIADPGIARKSTSISYGEDLLNESAEVQIGNAALSASMMIKQLAEAKDGAMTFVSSEFASLVGVSKEAMYEILTDLFDGKIKHDQGTRSYGVEIIKNPSVNIIAATTPKWIANQPPEHLVGGGFASRVIFVYEESVRQRKMYYDHLNMKDFDDMRVVLLNDLKHISQINGPFKHDHRVTRDTIEEWYIANADTPPDDDRVEGYFQRKPHHLHKIMMLLSLSERDDRLVTMKHFEAGKKILEDIEARMPKALQNVGNNPHGSDIDRVLEFVHTRAYQGPVAKSLIMRRFYREIDVPVVEEILNALTIMGDVKPERMNGSSNGAIGYVIPRGGFDPFAALGQKVSENGNGKAPSKKKSAGKEKLP